LVRLVLKELVAVITEQLEQGKAVTIAGFGRFEAVERKGRRGEGLDGEEYQVVSRLVPRFRPYPFLRLKLQGRAPEPPPRDQVAAVVAVIGERELYMLLALCHVQGSFPGTWECAPGHTWDGMAVGCGGGDEGQKYYLFRTFPFGFWGDMMGGNGCTSEAQGIRD
jgi:nucleoid DNA-binding protein